MKRHYRVLLLAGLLVTGKLHALSLDRDGSQTQNGATAVQQPAAQETPGSRGQQAAAPPVKKPAAPVSTFTPTEKISADSAVSFPVDI